MFFRAHAMEMEKLEQACRAIHAFIVRRYRYSLRSKHGESAEDGADAFLFRYRVSGAIIKTGTI